MNVEARIGEACPAQQAIALVSGKWRLLVLSHLLAGPCRFGEIHRALAPVTQKVLSGVLRGLEQDGLVWREVLSSTPPHVTYGLTPDARELGPIFDALAAWGERRERRRRGGAIG